MHTPNLPPDDNSSEGEKPFDDELAPIFNEATANPSMMLMDEAEFLYFASALIEPEYNPATMDIARGDDE